MNITYYYKPYMRLTHSRVFNQEERPTCNKRDVQLLTVEHATCTTKNDT